MRTSTFSGEPNVVQVVADIADGASGITTTVRALSAALNSTDTPTAIACLYSSDSETLPKVEKYKSVKLFGRFPFSFSFLLCFRSCARKYGIVHNHGLWSIVNLAAGALTPTSSSLLITSTHGTLSPAALRVSKLKKRLLWPLQQLALSRASLIHATSEEEYFQIRGNGFKTPVAIIPNGVDIPKALRGASASSSEFRRVLYFGRIHPIKGIERLLGAWRQLEGSHPTWELIIAGTGDSNYITQLIELSRSLGCARASFRGGYFGEARSELFHGSDLFVLPSDSENFGMVVAEALAHQVPVIVSNRAPWPQLETRGCGWWVDPCEASLRLALQKAMNTPPSTLTAMGNAGRKWMTEDFSWAARAHSFDRAYSWLLDGGDPPEFVRFN